MWTFLRRRTLTQWIIAAMVVGVLIGVLFPQFGVSLSPISTVFLRMIKSIIVPLIFGTLVVGIAGHGDDMKRVGRLALKSIIYFEVVTTLALFIGLLAVNILKPGVGVSLASPDAAAGAPVAGKVTFSGVLEHLVPQSFFDAAANNEMLQVVFWSVLFAIGLSQVRGRAKETMLGFCEAVAEVMFKFTGVVMKFAPFGVAAALAFTVGQAVIKHGGPEGAFKLLQSLGLVVLTLYIALAVFGLVVLLPVARLARVPLGRFIGAVKEPALIAFSTASSEAALPKAMEQMEAIGVPRRDLNLFEEALGTEERRETGEQHFERDGPVMLLIVGEVHRRHAAASEHATQRVAVGDGGFEIGGNLHATQLRPLWLRRRGRRRTPLPTAP